LVREEELYLFQGAAPWYFFTEYFSSTESTLVINVSCEKNDYFEAHGIFLLVERIRGTSHLQINCICKLE